MIDDRMLEEELDKYVHHSFPEIVATSLKKTRILWKYFCSRCIIEMLFSLGSLIRLFWTSDDVYPRFKIRVDTLS